MTHFPAAQRRGNGDYFAASKDDCGCQLLQLRGNSSVICRTYSRHLHIWFDQQRGNMLRFSLCSRWFCSFRWKLQNVSVRRDGPGVGFSQWFSKQKGDSSAKGTDRKYSRTFCTFDNRCCSRWYEVEHSFDTLSGDTRLEGGLKRPKGKGVYHCDFNKIKSTDFILIPQWITICCSRWRESELLKGQGERSKPPFKGGRSKKHVQRSSGGFWELYQWSKETYTTQVKLNFCFSMSH